MVAYASQADRFAPVDLPRVSVSGDGSLAAIHEAARITLLELPAAAPFAEIGADPDALASEVAWVGAPPRLLVLSRYDAHSTAHLIDPVGPSTIAEIRLEATMRLVATVGGWALVVGSLGAAVLTAGDTYLSAYQFPARVVPVTAGPAANLFLVALASSLEEWDPQSRMPRRRLRLPRIAAITAVGGSERLVWMTTQQEPSRIDVIPLVNRGQPKAHDLPEPILRTTGHPRSDLVACIGAESGRLYIVDLDGRTRLRVIDPEGIDRVDAASLVIGRMTGVLAAQAGHPVAIVRLDGRDLELDPTGAMPPSALAMRRGPGSRPIAIDERDVVDHGRPGPLEIRSSIHDEPAPLASPTDVAMPMFALRAPSPDELSPDELSPDELSPDELSPDELSADELSPDELSPDELSPDELSPDELSGDGPSHDESSLHDDLSHDERSLRDEPSHDEPSHDALPGHDEPQAFFEPPHEERAHDELVHDRPVGSQPSHGSPRSLEGRAQRSQPAIPLEGRAQRSQPAIPLEGQAQRSQPAISLEGQAQRSRPAISLDELAQRSQPTISLDELAQHSQPAIPLDELAHRSRSAIALEGLAQRSQPAIPLDDLAQRSQPAIPLDDLAQRSQPAIPLEGQAQRSQPAIALEGRAQRSQPAIPLDDLAQRSQLAIPLDELAQRSQSAIPLEGQPQRSQLAISLEGQAQRSRPAIPLDEPLDVPRDGPPPASQPIRPLATQPRTSTVLRPAGAATAKAVPTVAERFSAWRDMVRHSQLPVEPSAAPHSAAHSAAPRPAAHPAPPAPRSEAPRSWRDELVTWHRAAGASADDGVVRMPDAPAIDALAARFELAPRLAAVLARLYGAHLCGEAGVAPVDVARLLDQQWDEALGRGELARSGICEYVRSRVALSPVILRALDELPPLTGTLIGTSGAVALLGPCVVVGGDEPLAAIAERCLPRVGGAILVAHADVPCAPLAFEARAYGAVAMLRTDRPEPTASHDPVIFVVDDNDLAERLGVPHLT